MKRVFWGLVIPVLTLVACSKDVQPPTMSKHEVSRRIDSLSKIRIQEVNYRAQKELEHRLKIELKVKVDSILNARDSVARAEAAKTDTAHNH
jgi:hypothetical protein